jgi:uncharacterized protein (DUF983 family)
MKMSCPHCGVSGNVKEEFIGRTLKCPKCGESITVTKESKPSLPPEIPPSPETEVSLPAAPQETFPCSSCGNSFPENELINFEGQQICGACKPAFLQKLKEGATARESGGIEAGIAGNYNLVIGEVVSESWAKVSGTKGAAFGAVALMYIISLVVVGVGGALVAMLGIDENNVGLFIVSQLFVQLLYMVTLWVFSAGVIMIGVRRAADQPFGFSMLFDGFSKVGTVIAAMLLQTVLITLGFALLIIPGIYLSIAYALTLPLIMEKGLSPWEALETSRKAIHHCWFQVFGLYLLMGLIFMAGSITLGIGLIWVIPMSLIMLGIVYRIVFGIDEI